MVQTSPDGITWSAVTLATTNNWRGIAWSPELYRYVGIANAGTDRVLLGLVPKVADAPLNLTATSTSTAKVDLAWTPPGFDGNSTITGYRVERSVGGGSFTTLANVAGLSFQDTGIDPNITYSYRVLSSIIGSAAQFICHNMRLGKCQ